MITLLLLTLLAVMPTYHRSSLVVVPAIHLQDSFAMDIHAATQTMPFPDKYDQLPGLDPYSLIITRNDHCNMKQVKDTTAYRGYLKVLNDNNMGQEIVKRWFNFDAATGFNTAYLAERGFYDASELSKNIAAGTISGEVNVADAGAELISKTFVLCNDMAYIDHAARAQVVNDVCTGIAEISKSVNDAGKELASSNTGIGLLDGVLGITGSAMQVASAISDLGTDLTVSTNELLQIEGFAVLECTYLFQLDWSPEVQNKFYSDYYTETGDKAKIAAFLADTETFRLKYVGMMPTVTNNATAFHLTQYATMDKTKQIAITCSRTLDAAISSLQTKFEPFRVYTPITEVVYNKKGSAVTGVVAPIGTKESVTAKKKYQILQCTMDRAGRTRYTVLDDNVKANSKAIWDNRYAVTADESDQTTLNGTTFNTKKNNLFPGLLLIESSKK